MNHPKLGMKYEDAKRTAIRHVKEGSGNVAGSMVEQVRKHEGDKSANEFAREIESKGNEQRSRNTKHFT